MANRYAVANGNWSNTATWDGGTLPQAGDDVRANGFAVTINQDINVASIRTDALAPAISGGSFTVSGNGRILTCDVQTGTSTCLFCTTAISWFLYGNVRTYSAFDQSAIRFTTTANAILTMVGNINGNTVNSNNGLAVRNQVVATINLTGNIIGGSGNNCPGLGPDTGTSLTLSVTGNITGGTNSTSAGVNSFSNVLYTVNGICIGGIAGVGINAAGCILTGTCIASGCPTAGGNVGISANTSSNVIISEAIFTDCPPTFGKVRFKNINPKVTVLKANGTSQVLVEAGASGDFPIAADVRSGISYASGSLTGTLSVPLPANVRKGVPTDNTVGTADLTAADFWNTLTSTLTTAGSVGKLVTDNLNATISSRATQTSVDTANTNINNLPTNVWDKATNTLTTSGSIGERLKTASTVQTTGDQLASYQV
jgi:hypothetical protein